MNRHFVFRSLVRSRGVVVVDSPHFHESEWCRKEAWLADTLSKLGYIQVHRVTGAQEAIGFIESSNGAGALAAATSGSSVATSDATAEHDERRAWVSLRILSDIDSPWFTPNLHSVRANGLSVSSLESMVDWLSHVSRQPWTDANALRPKVVGRLSDMYAELTRETARLDSAPQDDREHAADPRVDLWATAAQLTVAALSLRTSAYSKPRTRQYVASLGTLSSELIRFVRRTEPPDSPQLADCFALAAGAAALDLARSDPEPVAALGLAQLIGGLGIYHDGLLLLDVRTAGAEREQKLGLAILMITSDLASVGVLQDGHDPVHEGSVDGMQLDILPCVTMYPGMESLLTDD